MNGIVQKIYSTNTDALLIKHSQSCIKYPFDKREQTERIKTQYRSKSVVFKGNVYTTQELLGLARAVLARIPRYKSSTMILPRIQQISERHNLGITMSDLLQSDVKGLPGRVIKLAREYNKLRIRIEMLWSKQGEPQFYPTTYDFLAKTRKICDQFGVADCGQYMNIVSKELLDDGITDFVQIPLASHIQLPRTQLLHQHCVVCLNPGEKFPYLRGIAEGPGIIIDAWDRTVGLAKEQVHKILRILGKSAYEEVDIGMVKGIDIHR